MSNILIIIGTVGTPNLIQEIIYNLIHNSKTVKNYH